jgi:hypothetical protein
MVDDPRLQFFQSILPKEIFIHVHACIADINGFSMAVYHAQTLLAGFVESK